MYFILFFTVESNRNNSLFNGISYNISFRIHIGIFRCIFSLCFSFRYTPPTDVHLTRNLCVSSPISPNGFNLFFFYLRHLFFIFSLLMVATFIPFTLASIFGGSTPFVVKINSIYRKIVTMKRTGLKKIFNRINISSLRNDGYVLVHIN